MKTINKKEIKMNILNIAKEVFEIESKDISYLLDLLQMILKKLTVLGKGEIYASINREKNYLMKSL